MAKVEQAKDKPGTIEKLAGWNKKKGIWLVGGLAVAAVIFPGVGLAELTAGAAVETLASKYVHDSAKNRRERRH